jgi:tetrahydromethanopterin S-methyltransferase subunit A
LFLFCKIHSIYLNRRRIVVDDQDLVEKIQSELKEGVSLVRCRKCGCIRDWKVCNPLWPRQNQTYFSKIYSKRIGSWLKQMEQVKYSCLGCETCFAAVAADALNQSFSETAKTQLLSCSLEIKVNNNHGHL